MESLPVDKLTERIDSDLAFENLKWGLKRGRLAAARSLVDAVLVLAQNREDETIAELAAEARNRIDEVMEVQ